MIRKITFFTVFYILQFFSFLIPQNYKPKPTGTFKNLGQDLEQIDLTLLNQWVIPEKLTDIEEPDQVKSWADHFRDVKKLIKQDADSMPALRAKKSSFSIFDE